MGTGQLEATVDTFQIGNYVELGASATATRGQVIAIHKDSVRVKWEQRFGYEDRTTSERPVDLRNLTR